MTINRKIFTPIIIIVISICLFFAGFYTNSYLQKQKIKKVSAIGQNFVANVTQDKKTDAYNMVGKEIRKSQTQEVFNQTISNLQTKTPKYKTQSVYQNGNTFYITQAVDGLSKNSAGRTDVLYALNVQNEDGAWKIVGFSAR